LPRGAKVDKITFELARLRRWKFCASSEAMNADQRRLFEEALVEDVASLRAQLEQMRLQAAADDYGEAKPKVPPRQPRRQSLPKHLRRVEHRHEPKSTVTSPRAPSRAQEHRHVPKSTVTSPRAPSRAQEHRHVPKSTDFARRQAAAAQ
jgi:hypothetical protein